MTAPVSLQPGSLLRRMLATKYPVVPLNRVSLTDGIKIHPDKTLIGLYKRTLTQNMTVHLAATLQWIWGPHLVQNLTIHQTAAEQMTYKIVASQMMKIASQLGVILPVHLTQAMTVHQASILALGVTLLQNLKLTQTSGPKTTYHVTETDQLLLHDAIGWFWSELLTQAIHIHPTQAVTYVASPILTQAMTFHDNLKNTLSLIITDNLSIDDDELVKMIYNGQLSDEVLMKALYISPSGFATAWAVNTRTNAITEYTNFTGFASFAPMGLRYLAAGPAGIYTLDGDTDNGTDIIAKLRTGYAQLNSTKMSGIKGCYLAIRGQGQIYIKIITGDGKERVYQAFTQPGLTNTKVSVGKGIRTRYIAWELKTTGQDFDLDSLEFVPMLSDRRV